LESGVPGVYGGGGEGGHAGLGLEPGVEEPEAGYGVDVWVEFGEAVDCGEDAGYAVGFG